MNSHYPSQSGEDFFGRTKITGIYASNTSVQPWTQGMIATIPDDVLLEEVRRRGLEPRRRYY